MSTPQRYAFSGVGILLVGVTPWLYWVSTPLLCVTCVLLVVWAVGLMVEYLRWGRELGRKRRLR